MTEEQHYMGKGVNEDNEVMKIYLPSEEIKDMLIAIEHGKMTSEEVWNTLRYNSISIKPIEDNAPIPPEVSPEDVQAEVEEQMKREDLQTEETLTDLEPISGDEGVCDGDNNEKTEER